MAATDVTAFPAFGAVNRFGIWFRDNNGVLITGWANPMTVISLDGGGTVAGPVPVELGGMGFGYFELTAVQMQAQLVLGKATITNANASASPFEIRPVVLAQHLGRPDIQAVPRLEDWIIKTCMYLINQNGINGGIQQTYDALGNPDLSGAVQQLATGVTKGKLS